MEASSPAGDDVGGTGIEDLPADVLALVLRRLDGASLAAVGCASSGLRSLATDPATWRALCFAMWPSVRDLPCTGRVDGGHRALFADAFPFPCSVSPPTPPQPLPARLVSAVDLRHAGVCVLSRVVETDAASDWFLGAPFRVDALLQEGFTSPAAAAIAPADLELSWVLFDPATGRALNAAEDVARLRYEEFVRGKRARKESKARREGILDLCCSGVGAAAFLGFLVMLTFR